MKCMAIIPARKGSERLPDKNMRPFGGRPLIGWSLEVATSNPLISLVVVSSDDEEVLNYAAGFGVKLIDRPSRLARRETPMDEVIIHALEHQASDGYVPDLVALLQPTSPLRTSEDISMAFAIMESTGADAVHSVSRCPPPSEIRFANRLHRIKASSGSAGFVAENGAVFLVKRAAFETSGLFPELTYGYYLPPARAIDINTIEEFDLAELALRIAKREVVAA